MKVLVISSEFRSHVSKQVIEKLFSSLSKSTWAENHPQALKELREYKVDMEKDVERAIRQAEGV